MPNFVTLYIGKSWTGKTARMLHDLQAEKRVVIADPKCAQLVSLRSFSHLWPEYMEPVIAWDTPVVTNFFEKRLRRNLRTIVHIRAFHAQSLNLLCRLLLSVKNLTLAVDELGLFCPPGPAGVLPKYVTSTVVSGSHDGIGFMATVQRPSMVHKTILAVATRMLIFRVTEPNDLALLSGMLPREFVDRLPALPDHVCLDWTDQGSLFVDESYAGRLGHLLPASRSGSLF